MMYMYGQHGILNIKGGGTKGGQGNTQIGKESLSEQRNPNSTGVLDPKTENKPHCCARVLGFCREGVHEKVGRETIEIGKDSLFTLSSWPTGWSGCAPSSWPTGWRGCAPSCLGGLKRARPWFLSQVGEGAPQVA
jgi:hypothetical protein